MHALWAVDTTNTNKLISECINNNVNNEISYKSSNNNKTIFYIDKVKLASFGDLITGKYMKFAAAAANLYCCCPLLLLLLLLYFVNRYW